MLQVVQDLRGMSALQKSTAQLRQIKAIPWKPLGWGSTLGTFHVVREGHGITAQIGVGKKRIRLRGQFGIDLSRCAGP